MLLSGLGSFAVDIKYKDILKNLHVFLEFLDRCKPVQVNVANVERNEDLYSNIKELTGHLMGFNIDLCFHYSISKQYKGNLNETIQDFIRFYDFVHANYPDVKLLVVSGTKKRKLQTAVLLDILSKVRFNRKLKIGVVYNPFTHDDTEKKSFLKKIKSGMVDEVYTQLGDNLEKIESSLKFLSSFRELKLFGSVLYPSTRNLFKLRSKPIHGSDYSDYFRLNIKSAARSTEKIIKLYKSYGAQIILEFVELGDIHMNHH